MRFWLDAGFDPAPTLQDFVDYFYQYDYEEYPDY